MIQKKLICLKKVKKKEQESMRLSKCRENTENINPKALNMVTMVLSKCAICGAKNQDLLKIRNQKEY